MIIELVVEMQCCRLLQQLVKSTSIVAQNIKLWHIYYYTVSDDSQLDIIESLYLFCLSLEL